jgi:hypothetical protein
MTKAFAQTPATTRLPILPDGWPVSSYDSYKEAQQAVDHLAGEEFPVQGLTIVGIDPMLVERVDARLTWRRVLAAGAASGAWLGLFVGLLLSLFTVGGGVGTARRSGGRPAGCATRPRTAERARDLLAALALRDN